MFRKFRWILEKLKKALSQCTSLKNPKKEAIEALWNSLWLVWCKEEKSSNDFKKTSFKVSGILLDVKLKLAFFFGRPLKLLIVSSPTHDNATALSSADRILPSAIPHNETPKQKNKKKR